MTYCDTSNHIPGDADDWYDVVEPTYTPKVYYSPADVAVHPSTN